MYTLEKKVGKIAELAYRITATTDIGVILSCYNWINQLSIQVFPDKENIDECYYLRPCGELTKGYESLFVTDEQCDIVITKLKEILKNERI